jgi:hypothetical protein
MKALTTMLTQRAARAMTARSGPTGAPGEEVARRNRSDFVALLQDPSRSTPAAA